MCSHEPGSCGEKHRESSCACQGTRLERFLEPCLLLLLLEKPAHGYELLDRLSYFGFSSGNQDPGVIYRNLRRLEKEGLVSSSWQTGDTGPARRHYQVTTEGREYLEVWVTAVQQSRQRLDKFLQHYRQLNK